MPLNLESLHLALEKGALSHKHKINALKVLSETHVIDLDTLAERIGLKSTASGALTRKLRGEFLNPINDELRRYLRSAGETPIEHLSSEETTGKPGIRMSNGLAALVKEYDYTLTEENLALFKRSNLDDQKALIEKWEKQNPEN